MADGRAKKSFPFVPPTEYWLEFHGGRLTLFYTLPLKTPVAIHGKATLEVFDPEYFVAFTFPEHKPVTLTDAPAGCTARISPAADARRQDDGRAGAIPADQHDLPPELQDAAAGLANLIALQCPGEAGGSAVNPFEAVMAAAAANRLPVRRHRTAPAAAGSASGAAGRSGRGSRQSDGRRYRRGAGGSPAARCATAGASPPIRRRW